MKRLLVVISIILSLAVAGVCHASAAKARKPGPADKCAVCGMFVASYKDFGAQLQFKDGSVLFFDGPKDMFKYYHGLAGGRGKKLADVSAVFVTSYYNLAPIDGLKAYFVAGSDVMGPMGRDLVCFEKEGEAGAFKKDHKGKAVFRFKDITPAVVKQLE